MLTSSEDFPTQETCPAILKSRSRLSAPAMQQSLMVMVQVLGIELSWALVGPGACSILQILSLGPAIYFDDR